MGKRDAMYSEEVFDSPYPAEEDLIYKQCDICGLAIAVNNWPDGKSRTPRFKKLIVCVDCDPRNIFDRYLKEGYRIMFPDRLRIIKLAQVTRALSNHGCLKKGDDGLTKSGCKCAGCTAEKLMPPF